jgi:hypothetical protein
MALTGNETDLGARPSIRDLHRIMDDSFVVRHVAVGLESCNATDDAAAAKSRMEEMHFDVMGLRENGVITGYVRREDLRKGHCRTYRKGDLLSDIIASRTPLRHLLPIMAARPFLFVLEATEINSLVARADLQKPPVRMFLFGLLSLLEMHLLSMVRLCYPAETLQRIPNLEDAHHLYRVRRQRNEDIDLADCLMLTDKTVLLLKVAGFAEFFGLGPVKEAERYFTNIESLRNKLAHGQDLVKGSSWERVIKTVMNLESFLEVCDERYDGFRAKFAKQQTEWSRT